MFASPPGAYCSAKSIEKYRRLAAAAVPRSPAAPVASYDAARFVRHLLALALFGAFQPFRTSRGQRSYQFFYKHLLA